ncbi:mn2+ homeostasis protein per1 [Ophiostoma piceae UAMH 11346]|uniref:Post-GPI attachment to proteins factor 3 n=1 Tax=Ophiostoma piceae (strain UAMH 11346) TaxID=1262450 RepID=S3BW24_OPHP1|nr:mn2+ homeostasis protein per1 [Ophiostoma piceae UAMH 11346]
MATRGLWPGRPAGAFLVLAALVVVLALVPVVSASVGDRLPEFRDCMEVCKQENCGVNKPATPIPFHLRLLLWNCASECDQTCQRIISSHRITHNLGLVQFHGKWPFYRLWGIQEPASVAFSLGNLWAHVAGLRRLRRQVPASYSLRPWYVGFGTVGMASWTFSSIFHTRDFVLTERLDYFAAGASVLYGLYFTVVRVFRLDRAAHESLRSVWTLACLCLYAAHVAFLTLVRWDYGYNMAANVLCGVLQNALWSWFSYRTFVRTRRFWAVWPGIAVAWVMLTMSLELFDFPPAYSIFDAHSLWHLGTIGPTILWYNFLIKDALDDIASKERLKD